MAKIVRQFGRALWVIIPLALVVMFFVLPKERAAATTFTYGDPFWDTNSPSLEKPCDTCGCDGPSEFTLPGVSVRTGEAVLDFDTGIVSPEVHGSTRLTLRYRSGMVGGSQFGDKIVPSFLTTVEKVIHNPGSPNSPGGHSQVVRFPSGSDPVVFVWGGSSYGQPACCYHGTLTLNGSGNCVLTDPWGNVKVLDANGMIDTDTDVNGNVTDYAFTNFTCTGWTNPRGQTYSIAINGAGLAASVTDPNSLTTTFGYTAGRLTSLTTPATPDQTSGITQAFIWSANDFLVKRDDGRGNTPWELTQVGATYQVSVVTGSTISLSYTGGRTDVTDRRGFVRRYHYSGTNITKTEHWISGAPQFATNYGYSGSDLATIVYPRNNRVDFTRNGLGQVTLKRRKTSNTAGTSGTDIDESWGYTSNFLTSYTDPLGNTTTYGRDGVGNLTSISYPNVTNPVSQSSVSKSFTVNSEGQRTQETDEEGKVVEYEYFTTGSKIYLLKEVHVDPAGLDLTTAFDYDANFNVTTVTNPLGKVTTTTWDNLRRRTQVTDAMNVDTQFHYDGNGNLTSVDVENLDKDGSSVSGNGWLTTSFTYSTHDDMLTITEEIDVSTTRTTTFEYDDNQNRIRVTKPEGNKDKWTYNSRNLAASVIRGETSGVESTEELFYDDNGNLIELEDARNNDTTYTYDLFDRRTKTTNALGHYEETDYDKASNVTEVRRKDSSNNLLQRETHYFDERGRHWQTSALYKDPGTTYSDAVTTYQRFKTGHMRYVTNARSKVTESQYDNAWRLTKTIDAMGNEFANTYNAGSQRTAWSILEKDGSTNITHDFGATYDDVGRVATRTETDRTNSSNVLTTTLDYDSRGNLVWALNAAGNPTRYTLDGVGRMTKKEVALAYATPIETFTTAIVTQWGFDKNNRITSFKDDATNASTWTFDAKDRASTMVFPNTSQDYLYTYDANDNVTQLTDPAGNVIADTLDALNRNTARTVTLATGFVDTTSETRTFDALNRMTKNEDDDYKVEYTYGVNGFRSQVYEESESFVGGTAYTKTVTRTWNAVGGKATEAYPSGPNLTYSYNDIDAYSSISDGTYTIASWSYIGMRPKVVTFQNGTTQTNSYTGFRGEVATIHHQTSAPATILRLDYGYNAVHDRTYERYGASGSAGDAFEYDKARRLTVAWMGSTTPSSPSGNAYVKKIEYNMDDDGNRTSVVTTPYGQSPTTVSYTTNNLNQYTAVGGASPSHDANGNQTDNGTFTFKYNYKNLICEVRTTSGNTLVANYYYDALGRRVKKVVNGGVTQRYVYSGAETVSTYDGSDSWKQNFVFGQGIDAVLMLEQADILDYDADSNTSEVTRSFYHRSALGSVMDITGMSEVVVESYRYDAYGKPTITRGGQSQQGDPLGQHWAFTGRFCDEEVGLYCYRARHYDAEHGTFVQRDPLGYDTGPALYVYARAAPTRYRDPHGLDVTGPDGQPMPGTGDGLPMPTPQSLQAIADAAADPYRGRVVGARLHCGVNATFTHTGTNWYAYVQYVSWLIVYGDDASDTTSDRSGWHKDTDDISGGYYPHQGTFVNPEGGTTQGMNDGPGFPILPASAQENPNLIIGSMAAYTGNPEVRGSNYAKLYVFFDTYLIDLIEKRVVRRWFWWYSIEATITELPPVKMSHGGPIGMPTGGT